MIIGVLSDTHIPFNSEMIPRAIFDAFKGVDLIIHAGDFVSPETLDMLSGVAEVRAVYGNMDERDVRDKLNKKEIIKLGKFSIGLIHGQGHPNRILDYVRDQFSQDLDIIIFGHSHQPLNKKIGKTLFFNPGSPTDKTFAPYNSYGIIKIADTIEAEIVKL